MEFLDKYKLKIKKMNEAKIALKFGDEYPYELNPGDNSTPPDWAHRAARGVMADLLDRGGIKHELNKVDKDTRKEIVAVVTSIIRTAHFESSTKEPDFKRELISLCKKHNVCPVPTFEGEPSAHDPMHIVEFDDFWEEYFNESLYGKDDIN